jgi:hypothetical protein
MFSTVLAGVAIPGKNVVPVKPHAPSGFEIEEVVLYVNNLRYSVVEKTECPSHCGYVNGVKRSVQHKD